MELFPSDLTAVVFNHLLHQSVCPCVYFHARAVCNSSQTFTNYSLSLPLSLCVCVRVCVYLSVSLSQSLSLCISLTLSVFVCHACAVGKTTTITMDRSALTVRRGRGGTDSMQAEDQSEKTIRGDTRCHLYLSLLLSSSPSSFPFLSFFLLLFHFSSFLHFRSISPVSIICGCMRLKHMTKKFLSYLYLAFE